VHHRSPLTVSFILRVSRRVAAVGIALLLPHAQYLAAAEPARAGTTDEARLLDVGLVVFDPGIPADTSTHDDLAVFPRIRRAEAQYLPVMLRRELINSGDWGVVRVLPEASIASELLVTGTIVHSDGQRLELRITATDASGEPWLDQLYTGTATAADYAAAPAREPFRQVYAGIAADLLAVRRQKSRAELATIRRIALLHYASELAPQAFSSYLGRMPQGRYTLLRLPAEDDPMLARIKRVRSQEYLFIDTIDEQYATLADDMAPTYTLWRQFHAEQAEYRAQYEARVSGRDSPGRRGSFRALEQTYSAYKWSRIHQQDLEEVARGFNNEVAPTVMQASGTVFKLSGTLERQYREWRAILRRIFALETGVTPAP